MAATSPDTTATTAATTSRHAISASDKQRVQLNKLFKDPSKPVFIPPPPQEKTVRPPRDMMKNVQGSSAGAGSGEFHVYKANRRREYERIKLMEEQSQKEATEAEFEKKKREREEEAEVKTSRNRARRQKKKERAAGKHRDVEKTVESNIGNDQQTKKRRLVNEAALRLLQPDEDGENEGTHEVAKDVAEGEWTPDDPLGDNNAANEEAFRVTIHED